MSIRPVRSASHGLLAWLCGAALLGFIALAPAASASTILTFDVAGGVVNFLDVPQEYGDQVAGTPDGAGHAYGGGPEFTPNVGVEYGTPGEDPDLWTSGYGDLTNVYFNDQDSDTTLTLTLTAGAGFDAVLLAFDLASFSSGGQTIPGLSVLDGAGATLFAQGPTVVPGASTGGHTTVDFGPAGLQAKVVRLVVDLSGLGMQSDNVAIDNVEFAQAVPEPATGLLVGLGVLALVASRRRRAPRVYRIR